jgi:hypothetical protein
VFLLFTALACGGSNWVVEAGTDPMTDAADVSAGITSTDGQSGLMFSCKGPQLAMLFVGTAAIAGDASGHAEVEFRIDSSPAFRRKGFVGLLGGDAVMWDEAQNPGYVTDFAGYLSPATTLLVQTSRPSGETDLAQFDVKGADTALYPPLAACGAL